MLRKRRALLGFHQIDSPWLNAVLTWVQTPNLGLGKGIQMISCCLLFSELWDCCCVHDAFRPSCHPCAYALASSIFPAGMPAPASPRVTVAHRPGIEPWCRAVDILPHPNPELVTVGIEEVRSRAFTRSLSPVHCALDRTLIIALDLPGEFCRPRPNELQQPEQETPRGTQGPRATGEDAAPALSLLVRQRTVGPDRFIREKYKNERTSGSTQRNRKA